MKWSPSYCVLFVVAATATSCSSTRSVCVSAARPALLAASDCRICEGTGPCRHTFSRETCFGYDSSSGFIQFKALLPDGRCQILMARTCELKPGEQIHFDLAEKNLRADPIACGVGEHDKSRRRSTRPCEHRGGPRSQQGEPCTPR